MTENRDPRLRPGQMGDGVGERSTHPAVTLLPAGMLPVHEIARRVADRFGHEDERKIPSALPQPVDMRCHDLHSIGNLGDQHDIGTPGDTSGDRDMAGIAAHHL